MYKCEADNSIGSKGQDSIMVRVQCESNVTLVIIFHPLYQPSSAIFIALLVSMTAVLVVKCVEEIYDYTYF